MADVLVNSTLARGRKRMVTRKDPATKKAVAKYQKEKTKQIGLRFFPADMDLYDHIKSQENVNGYIKGLVRADMEKQQEV